MAKDLVREAAAAGYARISAPQITDDDLYQQTDDDFIAAPPVTLHAHVPGLMAAVWAGLRESVLAGPADRVARETVAAEVSAINDCPYCVDVHGGLAGDVRPDEFARWARATRSPGDAELATPPFDAAHAPYFIGTALQFHYVNRMVSAFLTRYPAGNEPVDGSGALVRSAIGIKNPEPGASLRFVAEAALPSELVKLEPAPEVARAWAALCDVAERCGERTLTTRVRTAVGDHIASWDGTDPDLGWRAPDEGPGARFALTVALAAYRVDDRLIEETRATHPTEAELVSIAAWASARAARRIASWL